MPRKRDQCGTVWPAAQLMLPAQLMQCALSKVSHWAEVYTVCQQLAHVISHSLNDKYVVVLFPNVQKTGTFSFSNGLVQQGTYSTKGWKAEVSLKVGL